MPHRGALLICRECYFRHLLEGKSSEDAIDLAVTKTKESYKDDPLWESEILPRLKEWQALLYDIPIDRSKLKEMMERGTRLPPSLGDANSSHSDPDSPCGLGDVPVSCDTQTDRSPKSTEGRNS